MNTFNAVASRIFDVVLAPFGHRQAWFDLLVWPILAGIVALLVAFAFVEEWIWYDEEDAALERVRYANYGYPVRGANLKSEKLALLRAHDGRYSSLGSAASAVREDLIKQWLKQE